MATVFSTFDTTPASAVAAIKAAILASTDWSNPAGDRVICTTTRGAAMVVDLADAAAVGTRLQFGVYRTTGLADKIIRYMQWRSSVGNTTDPLHCTVSAGKEHLFITVEGPRVGEVNPDSTSGSFKAVFFLCDLVPYFAGDTVPAVVCGGGAPSATTPTAADCVFVNVSRNAANNASWISGVLETLSPPRGRTTSTTARFGGQSMIAASGTMTLRPWVVFEDQAGMRGRLSSFFYLGWADTGSATIAGDTTPQIFSRVSVGSATYLALTTGRNTNNGQITPFGQGVGVATDPPYAAAVVAVPYA